MTDLLLFIFFGIGWVGSLIVSIAIFGGIRSIHTPKHTPTPEVTWKIEYTETATPVHWRGDGGRQ